MGASSDLEGFDGNDRLSRCSLHRACFYAKEAQIFHIANSRFWEAALLPIAIVVVIAFVSCVDLVVGQFVSLSVWYMANLYAMSYTLQVLHPQLRSGASLWLGLVIATLEMAVCHIAGLPVVAHAVGTSLYGASCVLLHSPIWLPSWRRVRYAEERPRKSSADEDFREEPKDRGKVDTGGSLAGHGALLVAAYALVISWHIALGDLGPSRPLAAMQARVPQAKVATVQANSTSVVDVRRVVKLRSRPWQRNGTLPEGSRLPGTAPPKLNEAAKTAPSDRIGRKSRQGRQLSGPRVPQADRSLASAQLWDTVLLVGAATMTLLWLLDLGKVFDFSLPYLACYNIMCFRAPDLLGHAVIYALSDAYKYMSPAMVTTSISLAYMGAMQAYIVMLKRVCCSMSAQHLFPRFHYVAQMYYYLFWYMMLMVMSPGGVEDWNFWVMVAMLNGNYLLCNAGFLSTICAMLRCRKPPTDPPLKVLFDSKMAVQDQLADMVSLLVVPAIATSFHIGASLSVKEYPAGALLSLWQRFGVLLVARVFTGLLTEEIFRRRVDLLYKADSMELQLLPLEAPQNRQRYLNDICVGPKLGWESMRNIERCELYFTAVAVACTFAVFQRGDIPSRYAFVTFGL